MIKIKKKWLRRSLRVAAVALILVTVFVFFFIEGVVINRLESKLGNSYGDTYSISYKDINYSVYFSDLSIELTEVKVETDTIRANKMKSPVIDLESKSISLNNISLWDFFVFSEMNIKSIQVKSPHLSIAKNQKFEIENKSNSEDHKVSLSKHIKSFQFDEFLIHNGSVTFFRDIKMKDTLFKLKELNFRAEEFESMHENLSELLILDKYNVLSVESKSFKLNLGIDKYSIHVSEFKGELIEGNLQLNDIHFKPCLLYTSPSPRD